MATTPKHGGDPIAADGSVDPPREVSGVVDWAIGSVLALVGLLVAAVGYLLYTTVDRAALATEITADEVTVDWLSRADLVEGGVAFFDWIGIGLVAAGAVLLSGGVAFVILRRRTRKRAAETGRTTGTPGAHSVYGATAAAVLSFVPLSTVLGGAVAAYLRNDNPPGGATIGAAAALLGSVPLVVITASALVGVAAGAGAIGEGAAGTFVVAVGAVALVVALLINVGLGALGGAIARRM
jgi:hypothetical protein